MDMLLEVCVDSIESATIAAAAGANRVELCSALSLGGLTPSLGTLRIVKEYSDPKIPVFVMLRPRGGSDFVYSCEEMHSVLEDMQLFAINGADGFVFGALDGNGHIGEDSCSKVIAQAGLLPVTFHRAFDTLPVAQMAQNIEKLISLKFTRVLSSGMRATAEEGLPNLYKMLQIAGDRLIVMPGAGITAHNAGQFRDAGFAEFHASAREPKITNDLRLRPHENLQNVAMGASAEDDHAPQLVTSRMKVLELVRLGKRTSSIVPR